MTISDVAAETQPSTLKDVPLLADQPLSDVVEAIAQRMRARVAAGGRGAVPDAEAVIIGSGFGGIGAAVELKRAGIEDFLIIDKSDDIGGTWHVNTYPGVAVDIPSIYYSFSYEPPRTWSRFFAPGAEVKAYADQVVDRFGVRDRVVLNTTIASIQWDECDQWWRITTVDSLTVTARYVIGAVGGLEVAKMPDIDGIDDFAGKVVHTSRWDHSFDYDGKRIGVIGTGATALQLIPEIVDVAEHVTVFQRTPIWVLPKPDFPLNAMVRQTLEVLPPLRLALRWMTAFAVDLSAAAAGVYYRQLGFIVGAAGFLGRRYIDMQIRDPELAAALTPDYTFACKRPSVSNRYLKTFARPDVSLVTAPIRQVTHDAVATGDGERHALDVLVCATGFKVMEKGATPPFPMIGRNGLELGDYWDRNGYQAYQGVSIPNFPNLFLISGPYGYASFSYLAMIECTSRHAGRAIAEARRRGATTVEIRQEPHDAYYAQCRARHVRSLWLSNDCENSNTWYLNYQGQPAAIRPSTHAQMWWQNKHFPYRHYRFSRGDGEVAQ